jgi:hypothetical protein
MAGEIEAQKKTAAEQAKREMYVPPHHHRSSLH